MRKRCGAFVPAAVLAILAAGGPVGDARAMGLGAGGGAPQDPLIGRAAPSFALPNVDETAEVASDTLFDLSSLTMLAFWTTHCAECVRRLETCQELLDWGAPDGFNVIGINFDDQPSARIRLLARQTGPRVTHLYDIGGRVSSRYGAGAHSFSIYLVDDRGIVRDSRYEISVDSLSALRPLLSALMEEAFTAGDDPPENGDAGSDAGSPEGGVAAGGSGSVTASGGSRPGILEELGVLKDQKFTLRGRTRVRWMNIDTTGTGATGAYGEALQPGSLLHHRLELEVTRAITPRLEAGGLIRVSNEGEGVLRSGPDYLSTPWGSAYVRYAARGRLPLLGRSSATLRAGYYRVAFTPFTLMRWDQNDTPISGGQRAAGCGVCGGEAGMAGFIRLESLETLAPDVRFEGARLDLSLAERIDVTALYARPQTPWPTGYDRSLCCTPQLEGQDTHYRQELYGARATGHISVPWSSDLVELSATAMTTEEDPESAPCVIACMGSDPFSDRVLGVDVQVPLPHRTRAYGEGVASSWKPNQADEEAEALGGDATRGGITFDVRPAPGFSVLGLPLGGMMTRIDLSYQRLSKSFYSAYSALSYESNLSGPRAFARLDWGPVGLGFFYKRLEPVSVPADAAGEDWSKTTAGLWLDGTVWPGGALMLGGVRDERDLPHAANGREKQEIMILSFVQELAARSSLILEAQLTDGSREGGAGGEGGAQEYTSTTIRSMLDIEF